MDWRAYERDLGDALNQIGHESFPDDLDVEWRVLGYEHLDGFSYIEADAVPDQVGYPRFKFVIERGDDVQDSDAPPKVVGCYCWDDERWILLFGEDPGDLHPGMTGKPPATGPRSGCAILLLAPAGATLLWLLSNL